MAWFDQAGEIQALRAFFAANGAQAQDFGRRVYQTFEASTFAKVIRWYQRNGWKTQILNPLIAGKRRFRLKYNTKGNPKNFTYVRCTKGDVSVQIRHQLRVETFHNRSKGKRVPRANVVCDVAVVRDGFYDHLRGNMHVYRTNLITFAEAKHMDAYAELVAGFIGLVHELQPKRLSARRAAKVAEYGGHPPPFLNLSGVCMGSAEGLKATIRRRRLNINVYDSKSPFLP